MPRQRRLIATAVAVALLSSACGGLGAGGGSEQTGSSQQLNTMGFGTGDEVATIRAKMAKQAIAPTTVKFSESAFNEQQFLSSVASNKVPDLVYMDRQLIGTFAERGTLQPLSDCIESEQIDMEQYRKPAVQESTYDGEVYGLPEFYNNRVLLINDASLTSKGLKPDQFDTTDWDKLSANTQMLTDKKPNGDLSRLGFDPKIPEFFPMWAKANGASLISKDGKKASLDDPKVIDALEYTVDLVKKQGGWGDFKAFRDSFDFFGAKNQFAKDQLAAFPMEDWYLNVLGDNSPNVKFSAKPMTDTQGRPIDWVTGSAWAIPAKSENADKACKFIKTITSAKAWIAAAKGRAEKRKKDGEAFTGIYTGNQRADEKIFGEIWEPTGNKVYDNAIQTIQDAQDHAFTLPSTGAGSEFQTAWQEAINRVLSGQQRPKAALTQAQKQAQKALDEANGEN